MPAVKIKVRETDIVRACLEYLNAIGVFAYRNNTGAVKYQAESGRGRFLRFGHVGSSDIIGILPDGRFLAVECKTPDGRLSEPQRYFLDEVRRCRAVAIVARSVDDLIAGLKEQGGYHV